MEDYYANYAGLTVEQYVDQYIRSSEEEMSRMSTTVDLMPNDVETVLDVGAGHGIFLEELNKRRGINGVGIEITDAKIQYGKTIGIDMRKGNAAKLDFPDNSFDVVVSCEVIEHLSYGTYESALSEFSRVARKYIIITVPFDEDRSFIKCPYCGSSFHDSGHFHSFTEDGMMNLFSKTKLEKIEKIGKTFQYPFGRFLKQIQSGNSSNFSSFTICPVCGFKKNNVDEYNHDVSKISYKGISKETIKKIITPFSTRKARWILGLYSKQL